MTHFLLSFRNILRIKNKAMAMRLLEGEVNSTHFTRGSGNQGNCSPLCHPLMGMGWECEGNVVGVWGGGRVGRGAKGAPLMYAPYNHIREYIKYDRYVHTNKWSCVQYAAKVTQTRHKHKHKHGTNTNTNTAAVSRMQLPSRALTYETHAHVRTRTHAHTVL